uniref:DnaJ homologue subfamily C GRV2/DNAJC13 N-terminal domain-containing protein n=1 Tax=Globisporangium ultimum (strain ATCC 200006 / CBS 805.95 / DAOM BR144) TaxID=431595 RepID=K3W7T5_GLOUD
MATARASVHAPTASGESFHHMRHTTPNGATTRDTHLFQTSTTSSEDDEQRRGDSLYSATTAGGNGHAASSDDGSSSIRSRYQSARDRVSFLSKTPIEEFVAKYQVVKSSWRGKYERILALAPTRFCTIDPKDFEVTNTWSLNALLSISLEPSDPEGFTLLLRGQKKEEQLKLRCRFRSRLLSDLYRLQDQALQRRSALENQFSCSKWSRKDVMLSCTLEIGMDGVTCTLPDGSMRSKYLYVDMEHLTMLSDTRDGFAFGYTGRSRLFFSDQRSRIMQRIQAAAEAIGCMIYAKNNASALTTMAIIKQERVDFGKSVGAPFVQFNVQKVTVKYEDPVDRVLSLHEKHLVELDVAGDVVSCVEYQQIGVLVRHQKSVEDFEIQYQSGETRRYVSRDRDGVLAAIYDLCVTCNENPELFISCAVNERGLRLLPFFAVEDAVETTSFFGDSSIGNCFLQRMSSVAKMGSSQKLGDKGFLEIVAEFNANVPASGLIYNTKQLVITDALRPLGAQLYYLSKAKPLPSRSAVTLLQALCRIASSYYGFREVAQVGQMADSITNLLRNGDEFAVFWTTLLLRKLTAHVIPTMINLDESSIKFCEEVEAYNKTLLFGNSYLVQSLIVHLEGIDVDQKTSKRSRESRSSRPRRVGPLVVMGLLQTFEGCLCSRKFTTGANEFQVLVGEIAKHYSTLLKVLFQSRCATTVEACTLLLKATLEECDPAVAMQIRDAALVEGIVLRHVYQAIFDDSFDQRCVSRYLISLWMSHHTPSMQLLARIIPPGFFPFLDEPPVSAAELEEFDQIELEGIGMEREDTFEFDDEDRMSFLSEMSSAHDETAEPMDESKFFGPPQEIRLNWRDQRESIGQSHDNSSAFSVYVSFDGLGSSLFCVLDQCHRS